MEDMPLYHPISSNFTADFISAASGGSYATVIVCLMMSKISCTLQMFS